MSTYDDCLSSHQARHDHHREMPSRSRTLSSQEAANSPYSQSQYSKSSESTSASSIDEIPLSRPLEPGVYSPTSVFFNRSNEDLDHPTIGTHAVRLVKAGVKGLVVQGSNGEAVHLSRQEKKLVTKTVRKALDDAGYHSVPIIVGCGAESVRETIELCGEALASGGDYALILPPSYYASLFNPHTIIEFFRDVADASPIPVMIYNFPKAARGIDLDSDMISNLARHGNIAGVKATCGNTGKMNRIASAVNATTPFETGSGFMCMAGSADFIVQSLVAGGSGVICGLANIAPKACVRIVELYTKGKMREAQKLQAIVARGDGVAIASGVIGTKSALETYFGYGGIARKPLPPPTKDEVKSYADGFKELIELENSL